MLPSDRGGDAKTIFLQPATIAGTPNISAVLGSTAVPPGMYRPTASIGLENRLQRTPGIVSTCSGLFSSWAAWNFWMFWNDVSMALMDSGDRFIKSFGKGALMTGDVKEVARSNL
jgi:hypothetical protein